METSSLTFSKHEVAVILPALEDMVNGLGDARRGKYPRRDATHVPYRGQEVYRERCFDEEMAAQVLSCRNKLKGIGASRKTSLNSFELAAAALARRVVRREKLVSEDLISSSAVADLEHKLELHRKCAKRAAIKLNGPAPYKDKANRWGRFVEWVRYNLLYYRPRRQEHKGGTLFYKEQRETMRALAIQVVGETADRQIHDLADLARRELRRKRHKTISPTLRALISDHDRARHFLANFILKRECLELLRPEFVPECYRASLRAEKLRAAFVLDDSTDDTPAGPALTLEAARALGRPTDNPWEQQAADTSAPAPTSTCQPTVAPKFDLPSELAEWLINEVDRGYWQDVADDIRYQIWIFADRHRRLVVSGSVAQVIAECRPAEAISTGPEMISFYAEWAARWLLALHSAPPAAYSSVEAGMRLAHRRWEGMELLTRQRKMSQIYRRYFS
jgi:hypothetical protein